ncbi:zinc finger protein 135-like isoform X1 [Photinus pyralis]|uniref:BTB domain-containing protein n=1 Tax=Photinus pyralis TaxID=7054 RepID=A0A1Y1JWN8_PHOPY|nr:zinc finger protein 135-like isoform X1 [Photinus pyralis]
MGSVHYCLRWNNHQSNLLGVFSQLLRDESLVDVTLACSEGHSIRAHKVVLSACSSYFQTLFVDHPSRHPIVILKDVRFAELRTLIEFMYKGEVNVEYCQLSALLKTAESLKIKGLAEMTNLGPSRDYKQDSQNEQTEPTELVNKESTNEEQERAETPPRICRTPERPASREPLRSTPPTPEDCGRNDMTLHSTNNLVTCSSVPGSTICSRISSPLNCEPVPGPSGLPPVQQVPLSLKKEVDWGGGCADDKNTRESPSDYARHPHDPSLKKEVDWGGGATEDKKSSIENYSEYSRHPHDSSAVEVERCLASPCMERPSSTHSSRSSTPFAFPIPSMATSLLEVGLVHPALLGEEIFRCTICMAAFPSVWLLEQHTALQHLGVLGAVDKPFICDQCGQSYRYRSAYIKHREQNHRARLPADKLFSCDVCGMQFRYLKSFKKHRLNHALERLHGKNSEITVNENKSDAVTDSQMENSSDHVSSSNEGISGNDVETISIKKENTSDDVGEGMSSDLEKTEVEQDDTIDSVVSSLAVPSGSAVDAVNNTQDASLLSLLRSDAADHQRERRFACPFCGKCVRSKENLKLHVRKHTGERPFVCLFCGRAFGGKSDLTRHLRIHTGERPYHCDMCGKCFARADYLSKHLTTHIHTPR